MARNPQAAASPADERPVGDVIAREGTHVRVRVNPGTACARCAAGRGCGAGLLAGRGAAREFDLVLPAGCDAAVGDRVRLALEPTRLLRAALCAYGLPLAALLLVPLAADRIRGPLDEGSLVALAAGGLLGGVVAARRLLAGEGCLDDYLPSIDPSQPGGASR